MNQESQEQEMRPEVSDFLPEYATDLMREKLEIRKLTVENNRDRYFGVLVIDSPELWQQAEVMRTSYTMRPGGNSAEVTFNLTPLKLASVELIESTNIVPSEPREGESKDEYEARKQRIVDRKLIEQLEIALGDKIPGNDFEQKTEWLNRRLPAEIMALQNYIGNTLAALDDGNVLSDYSKYSRQQQTEKIISSFADWDEGATAKYTFRMARPWENYILEFPLRGITAAEKKAIHESTPDPEPPMTLAIDPRTKKRIPNQMVPNYDDPAYMARRRSNEQKKIVAYFSHCLTFDIPGDNPKEKYDWISLHVTGDVLKLKDFIDSNVISYRDRYDFFYDNFGLLS